MNITKSNNKNILSIYCKYKQCRIVCIFNYLIIGSVFLFFSCFSFAIGHELSLGGGMGHFQETDDIQIMCHLERIIDGVKEKSRWPLIISNVKTVPEMRGPIPARLNKIKEDNNVYWILSGYGVGVGNDDSVYEELNRKKYPVLLIYDANKEILTQHRIYRYDENSTIAAEDKYTMDGISGKSFYGIPWTNNCKVIPEIELLLYRGAP